MGEQQVLFLEDVEALARMLQEHFDRTATLNNQTSVRIQRIRDLAEELGERVFPEAIIASQVGIASPELEERVRAKMAELGNDVSDLGETVVLLANSYNQLWTEIRRFIMKVRAALP